MSIVLVRSYSLIIHFKPDKDKYVMIRKMNEFLKLLVTHKMISNRFPLKNIMKQDETERILNSDLILLSDNFSNMKNI